MNQELENVMKSLGGSPPWGVLHAMIDSADSDRNGKVKIFFAVSFVNQKKYHISNRLQNILINIWIYRYNRR